MDSSSEGTRLLLSRDKDGDEQTSKPRSRATTACHRGWHWQSRTGRRRYGFSSNCIDYTNLRRALALQERLPPGPGGPQQRAIPGRLRPYRYWNHYGPTASWFCGGRAMGFAAVSSRGPEG